jgi:hypothetical protein
MEFLLMFGNVKTVKRQQAQKCRVGFLLSAVQLNKVQEHSVAQKKPCFNSFIEGLGYLFVISIGWITGHNRSPDQGYFCLISISSGCFFKNLNRRVGISSHI